MELCGEMLSDDTVRLSNYDVMVVHSSLTYTAPERAANVALQYEMRTHKSLAMGPVVRPGNRRLGLLIA